MVHRSSLSGAAICKKLLMNRRLDIPQLVRGKSDIFPRCGNKRQAYVIFEQMIVLQILLGIGKQEGCTESNFIPDVVENRAFVLQTLPMQKMHACQKIDHAMRHLVGMPDITKYTMLRPCVLGLHAQQQRLREAQGLPCVLAEERHEVSHVC